MEISLDEKVKRWVEKEGYPLEFSTAHKFKKRRFSVEQSYFAKDENGKAREVDVLATANVPIGRSFLRIKHVVECKWSKDKPWVLFKDEKRFATSALAAQLISSSAGQAIAWAAAGNEEFKELGMFKGEGFSFSGRQAFSKGNDLFYQAVQGVVSNCLNITRFYDEYEFAPEDHMLAVITLPLIVIEGGLHEATYAPESDELQLNSINHARLRWKGNERRQLNTVIDVVTSDYLDTFLDTFLDTREKELEVLVSCFGEALQQLIKCFQEKTEKYLVVREGARGISGRPNLLRKLSKLSTPNKKLQTDASDDAPFS
ncbi:hypothetical protein ACP86_18205 [Marinobacter sp. CP1]|jgi:hypothetical protein|uniref:Uncharacterized protein n=1 Tax=Marinobacter adhaerens TaxID=1033846 RepID=A0A352IPB7_9GAMM|nr:hypothetical protein ACP86_18205 [Marinobacter sp. CP1]HBC33300.1 hypothetical protein [Marinobacter adhaerens]|tara:strand:- start:617 stop:1561 length:945 start_codon:yes stop_codon:yes gene_type:complete